MNGTPKMIQPSYLLKLTWPVFVELILQMLVGNMDQFMVGQYSQLSVGAIGNANQILNVLIIIVQRNQYCRDDFDFPIPGRK